MPKHPLLRPALAVLLLAGCSTDLDINAPYQDITIVYALFSTNDNASNGGVHFVKINKAFLGEGDAFVFAQVPDSNQYTNDELVARVEEVSNGQVTDSWSLNDTLIDDRSPGTFFAPEQILYYFSADLDPDRDYRVVAEVKGQRVEAVTPVVDDFPVNNFFINPSPSSRLTLYGPNGYQSRDVKWTSGDDGKRYESYYRFNYAEVRGTDTSYRSFSQLLGTVVALNTNGGESMQTVLAGESFYQAVGNLVQDDPVLGPPDKRLFFDVTFIWLAASEDLHTYLRLQEPLSGIVEERPDFTNVTNGYGLVGSRFRKEATKRMDDVSLLELVQGPYTGHLGFCSFYNVGPPLGCN